MQILRNINRFLHTDTYWYYMFADYLASETRPYDPQPWHHCLHHWPQGWGPLYHMIFSSYFNSIWLFNLIVGSLLPGVWDLGTTHLKAGRARCWWIRLSGLWKDPSKVTSALALWIRQILQPISCKSFSGKHDAPTRGSDLAGGGGDPGRDSWARRAIPQVHSILFTS